MMALKLRSLSTREKAKQMARKAERNGREAINLSDVEFVSRSFADELVKQAEERGLDIVGGARDVRLTLEVVGY
jgi:EAL domain-containing protein (putative c-di-GMP-specific phosphodiesterase class I)